MKKVILVILVSLISFDGFGQTIKFKQIEKAVGSGYIPLTDGSGTMVYNLASTSIIPEGSNLYYTATRFNTAFAAKSTTDLSEGTNLYYTLTRFNTAFAAKSTTDLTEGTNLYFTNARAVSAMAGLYEVPLTFSTGLTRSTNTVTSNIITGISGGQTATGGTAVGDALTFKSTTANGTSTVAGFVFNGGNNGATNLANIYNDGQFLIGTTTRNPGSLGIVRIAQGTGTVDIGTSSGSTAAIWFSGGTPTTSIFAISGGSTNTTVNAPSGTVSIANAGSQVAAFTRTTQSFTPIIATSGASDVFTFTTPANSSQTAGTETMGFHLNMSAIITHASNTGITLNRDFYSNGRTHAFASATGTITDAFSFYIDPPVAGTNAIITRAWAAGFNGKVGILSNLYVGSLTTAPTALIHLAAGTATASTAPIKYTSGTLLTTPEVGAKEFLTDDEYITITTGTARHKISRCLTGSATLNFPNTANGDASDLTVTVTGAADGDPVILGVPNGSVPAKGVFYAWVSAANTVTVRYQNTADLTARDPASGTFNITVNKNR